MIVKEGELVEHLPGEISFRRVHMGTNNLEIVSLKLAMRQGPLGCRQVTLEIEGMKYHNLKMPGTGERVLDSKQRAALGHWFCYQLLLLPCQVTYVLWKTGLVISHISHSWMDVLTHFIALVMNWRSVLQALDGNLRVNMILPVPSKTSQSCLVQVLMALGRLLTQACIL